MRPYRVSRSHMRRPRMHPLCRRPRSARWRPERPSSAGSDDPAPPGPTVRNGLVRAGYLLAVLLLALGVAGCGSGGSENLPTEWTIEEGRAWKKGVDTARAFRPMDDLAAMGIPHEEVVLEASVPASRQVDALRERLANGVRRALLPRYRYAPQVVDSLLRVHVLPRLDTAEALSREGLGDRIRAEARWAEERIAEVFTPPALERPDSGQVGISIPDSLESASIRGRIRTRVYLDAAGRPQAVQLLSGMHPVPDRSVLRAAARSRWQPARVSGEPVSSWAIFAVRVGE